MGLGRTKALPFCGEKRVGVELFRLFLEIEVSSTSRIAADTGDVLPVAIIAADVVVNELLLEKSGAVSPVEAQFVDQA